ncbi:MAG: ATP-grasp domain-containing protein, partial [Firmicutes bacterium]|nr:ATP-grasp domain-containing protein [Bacillota bacterium]
MIMQKAWLALEDGSVFAGRSFGAVGAVGGEQFHHQRQIWINQIAPRPHNTRHYSIEAG